MKRVILDCDGVIIDFVSAYLALLNKHGGTNYTHDDITDWDIVGCLGIPDEVARAANAEVDYDFCRNLKPIAGAVEGVRALLDTPGVEVLFLTSPWNSCVGWMHAREAWLYEHLGVKHGQVMHGSAKDWVKADVFVDDKASTVVKWQAAHPNADAFIWDQPWNRHTTEPLRCARWDDLKHYVEHQGG